MEDMEGVVIGGGEGAKGAKRTLGEGMHGSWVAVRRVGGAE